jgi:ribosomal protection tetracycline resistance protein
VTAVAVFDEGGAVQRQCVRAGEIATLAGLAEVRIGDAVGEQPTRAATRHFLPPTLEAVVEPVDPADAERLTVALGQLAEQDPLIGVRRPEGRELAVSLYGEVQKEVVQATLADDFGVEARFRETTTSTSSGRRGAARRSRCCTPSRTRSWRRSGSASPRRPPAAGSTSGWR